MAGMHVLTDNLKRIGKSPLALAFPNGTRLLLLPCSGRMLGLFTTDDDTNFLWTNSALALSANAASCFGPGKWPNPGGDRTWLAPEIELFVGDPARPFATYLVPPALDPGSWTMTSATATEVILENTTRLHLRRQDREVGVHLGKRFSVAANPLQGTWLAHAGLSYAGYTLVTTLALKPMPGIPAKLGVWNLLQLPQPGAMLIPTRVPIRPQMFFGALSSDELTVESRFVRWNMAAPGKNTKIALKAPPLTGRAGHLHETLTQGIWDLVVREFTVDPDGEYVDALWDDSRESGWAFQACCVRSGSERFDELEYHAPAVTTAAGVTSCRDESRVWAFRGPSDAISQAARFLLEENLPLNSGFLQSAKE